MTKSVETIGSSYGGTHHVLISAMGTEKRRAQSSQSWKDHLNVNNAKILFYFLLWFILSIIYNNCNKKATNALKMPYLIANFQIFCGIPIIAVSWLSGLRKVPSIFDGPIFLRLCVISALHSGCHLAGVLSMGAGAVSFAHIVKAGEPFCTAIFSIIIVKTFYSWQVYLTLIPVCVGVAVASASELNFSWLSFLCAVASAVFASLRGILSKESLKTFAGRHLQAQNLYAVLTVISFFGLLIPCSIIDGPMFAEKWGAAMDKPEYMTTLVHLVASGFAYFLYNEVAFLALEAVSPVTHAVGSTFKRIFIIGSSVIFLGEPMSVPGWIGGTTAVLGVFAFSMAKNRYSAASSKSGH
uniref:Sugar phosphate transporter domain-containing protein n=1 Tax=Spongospora subterranea TaxID=70186 RepID=A0A0H5R5S6_9EUKA|eukprot:CRZ09137.1 hypothetical protein [Spongospora subterranea]